MKRFIIQEKDIYIDFKLYKISCLQRSDPIKKQMDAEDFALGVSI